MQQLMQIKTFKNSEKKMRKKISDEYRKKISERMKGKNNHFYGKKHSMDSIEKMRIASTGRKVSIETRHKLSILKNTFMEGSL